MHDYENSKQTRTSTNCSSDIDFGDFMNLRKKYTQQD